MARILTQTDYRDMRADMMANLRSHRVDGDLIRHCDYHRDMQESLAVVRGAFTIGKQGLAIESVKSINGTDLYEIVRVADNQTMSEPECDAYTLIRHWLRSK